MWVDGRLASRYYGWNLSPFDDQPDYQNVWEGEAERFQDVFGEGFCRWIERAFQSELIACGPDFVLDILSARRHWPDTSSLTKPALIHIKWFDGSVCADVLCSQDLPSVVEFAHRRLRLRIEQQAFVLLVAE